MVVPITFCTQCEHAITLMRQSPRWASVLQPNTSRTLFGLVNFSFISNYIKINSRICFGPVNSNFHFAARWSDLYLLSNYKNLFWKQLCYLHKYSGVDPLLYDNNSHGRLIMISKLMEALFKLFHFMSSNNIQLSITDTISENNNFIGEVVVDLI